MEDHLAALAEAARRTRESAPKILAWGRHLAAVFEAGGRLLACGNGGSAAEAQHLTGELVGRYRTERPPLSALALHADTSSLTAIANDYGSDEAFARQVRAHGRPGDVLIVLTTSGRSKNVLAAVEAARETRLTTWALTGPLPNPTAGAVDDAIATDAPTAATVQEVQQVVVHLICTAVDAGVAAALNGNEELR
jgi:D-sedoheptulose 7-phosphate isomerase